MELPGFGRSERADTQKGRNRSVDPIWHAGFWPRRLVA